MGGVDADDIDTLGEKELNAFFEIDADTHGGTHHEPSRGVDGGVGIVGFLLDVLDGDEPLQAAFRVHERQFFDAVFLQDGPRLGEGRADSGGDEVFMGHEVAHRTEVVLGTAEADVAIGQYADKLPGSALDDGYSGDVEARHDAARLRQTRCGAQTEGIADHARL